MSNHPTCPVDGLPYTDHQPASPPSPSYRQLRAAFIDAIARTIYLPGVTDHHRQAILRARQERRDAP